MSIIKFLKYREQIIKLLQYSFAEVEDYNYLSTAEKKIIKSKKEFRELKTLIGQ